MKIELAVVDYFRISKTRSFERIWMKKTVKEQEESQDRKNQKMYKDIYNGNWMFKA